MRCCDCEYRTLCDKTENNIASFAVCGQREILKGKPKILEWIKAERDGRLVVFPCKVGDKLYHVYHDGTEIYRVTCTGIYFSVAWFIQTTSGIFDIDAFGETIFLTREEAESALAERIQKE